MSGVNAFLAADDQESLHRLDFYHNPYRWNDNLLDKDNPIRDVANWSNEIKYMDGDKVSNEIKTLPNNTGGIYMFYIKGLNLTFVENHVMYIGRCWYTNKQNIRKRANEYFREKKREKIKKMFKFWKDHLYYRYYKDTDNDRIDRNEVQIIRAILPPMNEAIPDKLIKLPEVPAFE